MIIKKLSLSIVVVFVGMSLFLTACTTYTKPPSPAILSKKAQAGALLGGLAGAWAGGITGSSIAAGAGIGVLVGGAIGTYYASEHYQLKTLQKMDVHVVQIGDNVRIILRADNIFPLNSSVIIPRSYPMLAFLTAYIKRYGEVPITVSGYTDNIGSAAGNRKISQHQAQSIMAYLWTHGVSSKNMQAIGFGEADPIANNIMPEGNAYNRRVEISFPVDYVDQHSFG